MKREYEQLVDYAYSILLPIHKEYMKGNKASYPMFILGVGNCKIESRSDSGHNYQAAIDAIHRLYLEDSRTREGFYQGLISIIDKSSDFSIAQKAFDSLFYQVKKEGEGSANFNIQHFELFAKLKEVVSENLDLMREINPRVDDWLKERISYYEQYATKNGKNYNKIVPSNIVFSNIQRDILGGQKVPHSVSRPVLYNEGGKLYLAVFVFFYTRDDIESGEVNRPSIWAKVDIESGKIIEEIYSKDREFSDASYDIKYNVRSNKTYDKSKEYYEKAFGLLDFVRNHYLLSGKILISEYEQYMQMILANIPDDYQRFYKDLSVM